MRTRNENFFEKFGLEVQEGEVEVGKSYPIYGVITKFIDDTPGQVVVELNFKITAKLNVHEQDKVNTLKQRALEPGIFVVHVVSKNDHELVVECSTVIFGKRSNADQ
jgi:hypothetical protein